MKNKFLTIGLAVLVIAGASGILIHSLMSNGPDASGDGIAKAPKPGANAQVKQPKPPKAVLRPEDLPPEVVAVAKKVLPQATMEVTQADPNKGQYRLKLTDGGKTVTARLRMANGEVTGNVNENLKTGDLPPVVLDAFKAAFPDATIESTSKRVQVGGGKDGTVTYRWDWGNNRDGEASMDGQWIRMQEEVASSQLPPAVTEAVAKAFPQGTIDKKADRIIENGAVSFEFAVKPADGGKKVDVRVLPDGTLKQL
jgi:hypothetical protein